LTAGAYSAKNMRENCHALTDVHAKALPEPIKTTERDPKMQITEASFT
jgi:hypothetical protein